MLQKKTEFSNIVNSLVLYAPAEVYVEIPKNRNILEFISFLVQIITPNLRVANIELLKDEEKKTSERVIQIMNHFGLSFSHDSQFNPQTQQKVKLLKLEP